MKILVNDMVLNFVLSFYEEKVNRCGFSNSAVSCYTVVAWRARTWHLYG